MRGPVIRPDGGQRFGPVRRDVDALTKLLTACIVRCMYGGVSDGLYCQMGAGRCRLVRPAGEACWRGLWLRVVEAAGGIGPLQLGAAQLFDVRALPTAV